MNWKREITAKQSIKNKKNVDDWKFSVHFISFNVLLFQSDRLPSTAHQSQFFQSSLFFISFLLHFKIAWKTFEARLLIGQQDNCARERVSLWIFDWSQTRFNRQHISIGSNNVYGTKQSGEAKMVVLLHFASRFIDIDISMLACTNYSLIIKLTASTRKREKKTVLCIAQFKLSGWIFDSRSISTFYPQIMQSCTQSANWAKKIHADTSPETILCRTSNIPRATNKKGLALSKAAAISHRVPFGLVWFVWR